MQAGDRVVLLDDPLQHGYGVIESVLDDGRLTVRWESGDIRPYHPQQLELADDWERQSTGSLTNQMLQRLLGT